MARQAPSRAGDFTGRQKAALEAKAAEEKKAAAKQMSLVTEVDAEAKAEPIEVKPTVAPEPEIAEPTEVGDIEVTAVDVKEQKFKFTVTENIEQMTMGYGNHFDFEMGQEYIGPKSLFDHLKERGLIWSWTAL